MAEREGFEPSMQLDATYTISNRAPSARLSHLSKWRVTLTMLRFGGEGGIRTPEER